MTITPYWMPEVGLDIGAERRVIDDIEWEWLFWYSASDAGEVRKTPRTLARQNIPLPHVSETRYMTKLVSAIPCRGIDFSFPRG
jgi:hypothetical protein